MCLCMRVHVARLVRVRRRRGGLQIIHMRMHMHTYVHMARLVRVRRRRVGLRVDERLARVV